MLDENKNSVYIWYSSATNVTGKKLAEALGVPHGRVKPQNTNNKVIVGWGTKTAKNLTTKLTNAINHPDKIRGNRNKLMALEKMKNFGVSVADFFESSDVINAISAGNATLPLLGRTKFHQGGKGAWNCPTTTHVIAASDQGAAYFQSLIEIKDEYRLHVIDGKVVYAVKKVMRNKKDMEEAYIRHETDRQIKLAEKNKNILDKDTLNNVLRRQAKKHAEDGPDMLIRSNKRGWKFSRIKEVKEELSKEAIKALKAIDLDFGAVDCCIDKNNKVWILEVNSGPGLEDTPFKVWVNELDKLITSKFKPVKKSPKQKVILAKPKNVKKDKLIRKLSLSIELLENANPEEVDVLKSIIKRTFE